MARDDEFYVGYLPTAPPDVARRVRRMVVAILCIAPILALLLVVGQRPFAPSVFEFGNERVFHGVIEVAPYPTLLVERPGATAERERWSRYPLVRFGKFGAVEAVAGLNRASVRLRGSLIYRGDQTMIQVADDSIERLDGEPATIVGGTSLGEQTLLGEIVDSKCYLGVMKPGQWKPHRSCAARCIAGGIPPVLVTREPDGSRSHYFLVDRENAPVNRAVLPMVAERVEITGEVVRFAERRVLRSDPSTYRRR